MNNAIRRIVQGLSEDPRIERVGDVEGPRDLLFTRRVLDWLGRLDPRPSEPLVLAAWGHDLHRWRLPRASQPMTTAGYHKWRRAQALLSAEEVVRILSEEGLPEPTVRKVRDLILKTDFPNDPDSQTLEDADCLAFLELKFETYVLAWDEAKTVRILKGTLDKMSQTAKDLAFGIPLDDQALRLIRLAMRVP